MARGYPDNEGEKSGLYLQPEWSAYEGIDKSLRATALDRATGTSTSAEYQVPAGKILYLTQATFSIYATDAADRDNNQIVQFGVWNVDTETWHALAGGNGGGHVTFPVPLKFLAGVTIEVVIANYSNHNCGLDAIALGYEI